MEGGGATHTDTHILYLNNRLFPESHYDEGQAICIWTAFTIFCFIQSNLLLSLLTTFVQLICLAFCPSNTDEM